MAQQEEPVVGDLTTTAHPADKPRTDESRPVRVKLSPATPEPVPPPAAAEKPTVSTEELSFNFSTNEPLPAVLGALSLETKDKIIVGVDYGTTFSGASYVSSKATDISEIVVISNWPGPSRDVDAAFKTPSRIAYSAENPRLSKNRWGYQVEPGLVSYSWTKLLLDKGTALTQYDDPALEDASRIGIMKLPEKKTEVDVVSDYFTEIFEHILKTIGKNITEAALAITPLEFWFTVPAIWSDRAQSATRNAARRAGFAGSLFRPLDKVFLITEPEAAAIAVLKKYSKNAMGGSVKAGDGVLVCDCGGGTVDITTYLVNSIEPLSFEELCTGIGGKCGSTAVDRNFYKLMSERFGEAFDKLPMKRKGPGGEFMKKFETLKRDFGVSDEETIFELPLNMTVDDPDPRYFDEEERLVIVNSHDLRKVFDPVVNQIIKLVKRQIEDANKEAKKDIISRIILVGGFGDSEYLRRAFKLAFEQDGKIAITVPEIPQAAIVQGAALRGLEGIRSSTKRCRRHYGFSIHAEYRPGIDDGAETYWDYYTDKKMVRGVMKWAIRKDQKYGEEHTEIFPLHWKKFPNSALSPRLALYACDQATAPDRDDHKDVYKVGDIAVDLSNVDLRRFDKKVINNMHVYDIQLQLKVTFGAQEGLLKFDATSQGRKIGETCIDFSTTKFY
ncbi:hypothetical protein BDW74DRAFT_88294 [Aspergillus multicolor]|uniref:Hsp70 family protein n=1 Tax=Aspergillus multicolor TaxID=41759 RepID=UPI003CCC934F